MTDDIETMLAAMDGPAERYRIQLHQGDLLCEYKHMARISMMEAALGPDAVVGWTSRGVLGLLHGRIFREEDYDAERGTYVDTLGDPL